MELSPLCQNEPSDQDVTRFDSPSGLISWREANYLEKIDFARVFAQFISEKHEGAQLIGFDIAHADRESGPCILARIMRTNSAHCGLAFETVVEDVSQLLNRAYSPSAAESR